MVETALADDLRWVVAILELCLLEVDPARNSFPAQGTTGLQRVSFCICTDAVQS
jgi:hypothetical protein